MKEFRILSVNISPNIGQPKKPVPEITLQTEYGIVGDAHARADTHRQVSLLAQEAIDMMQKQGVTLSYGDFAENITTSGIDLPSLPIGTKLYINTVILEVTQIGKECHKGCAIMAQIGDCIMPRMGIFTKVVRGGVIHCEDTGTYNI